MTLFEQVKGCVTARQAAEHYGIKVKGNGMACCPFHKDRHPSMKADKIYHCFACGVGGDAIDFTARLFGISQYEAAKKMCIRDRVTMPEEYMGDIIGDINSRRGRIEGMDDLGGGKIVRAFVPLSEMFGYSTDLRSRTQGRGNYSMFFDSYEQVPKSVQEKVLSNKNA